MNIERAKTILITILITILSVNMAYCYVPHHHHEGKICIENAGETDNHDTGEEDNFHSEILDFDIPRSDNSHLYLLPVWIGSDLELLFRATSRSKSFCIEHDPIPFPLPETVYLTRTHKLRGSPLFS